MNKGLDLRREIDKIESELSYLNSKFWGENSDTKKIIELKAEIFKKECELMNLKNELYNLY